jgi:hypothetical protein
MFDGSSEGVLEELIRLVVERETCVGAGPAVSWRADS